MNHGGADRTAETFYEIAVDILLNQDASFIEHVATDAEVAKTGQIMSYGSYDRQTLVAYSNKYGYDVMNGFVNEYRERLSERDGGSNG